MMVSVPENNSEFLSASQCVPCDPYTWLNDDQLTSPWFNDNVSTSLESSTESGLQPGLTWPSLGSIGHPHTCNFPCKFFKKKQGCLDGEKCLRCHMCEWRKGSNVNESEAAKKESEASFPPGFNLLAAAHGISSVGSIGHPHKCALACKYATKGGGCKDGASCVRCHLCRWSQGVEKTKPGRASNHRGSLANQHARQAAGQAQFGQSSRRNPHRGPRYADNANVIHLEDHINGN